MRSLVVGAGGFVGRYLIEELLRNTDAEVHATKLESETLDLHGVSVHNMDVRDSTSVAAVMESVSPDQVFHLAALSSVNLSWKMPDLVIDVNVKGAIHVLEAVRALPQMPRVLLVGSSEEYGFAGETRSVLREDSPVVPGNFYAVAKAAQNMVGGVYARAYGVPVMMARAFNHIGPGQMEQFVVSDFCRQVAMIESGMQEPVLRVGNLDVRRDFCDVRDIVRAYVLLIAEGHPGETYNIGSGKSVTIRDILEMILSLTDTRITVEVDPAKYRPTDMLSTQADILKLQSVVPWSPAVDLETTLRDVLLWWRERLGNH